MPIEQIRIKKKGGAPHENKWQQNGNNFQGGGIEVV